MMKSPGKHGRRASAYVLVLGVSMMVTVIGLSALMVARTNTRMVTQGNDWSQAWFLAMSATEHALTVLDIQEATWRSTYASGETAQQHDFGGGSFRWVLVDEADGDLGNDDTEPVRLYGIGEVGEARRVNSVLLQPRGGNPLTCLEVSLHAKADLCFNGGLQSDQIISTNQNATQSDSASIVADVEAVGTISLNNHTGTATEGITPRSMPDVNTVFDYYINHAVAHGTWLTINDIIAYEGKNKIQDVVLSPATNPYGGGNTSPEGIYVVDCMNQFISVRTARIVGTLVLLDPGLDSWINDQLNWEPAVANYPALLVQGNMMFNFTDASLGEKGNRTNYNPPGTPYPYPDGEPNGDEADTYPSILKGLVYVSGDLEITKYPHVEGVIVVGGTFTSSQSQGLNVTYQQTFLNKPPPGFGSAVGRMSPVMGTWQWTELPAP